MFSYQPYNLLFFLLFGVFSLSPAVAQSSSNSSTDIKVMSYNVLCDECPLYQNQVHYWKYRKELIFDIIDSSSPELIGLQEVRRGQLKDIEAKYSDSYGIYSGATDSSLINLNVLLFKKSKFLLLNQGIVILPNNSGEKRHMAWAELNVVNNSSSHSKIKFAVTHFDHSAAGESARVASANIVINLARAWENDEGISSFVVGDFNSSPSSETISNLKGFFNDLQCITNTNHCNQATHLSGNDKIDYIFGTGDFTSTSNSSIKGNLQHTIVEKLYIPLNSNIGAFDHKRLTFPSDHYCLEINVNL